MQNISKLSRFFLYIFVLSAVLWLGGYFSRLLLTYQLFLPKDLALKSYVTNENLSGILTTMNSAVSYTLILYPVMLLSFLIFLFTSRVSLKEQGWLLVMTLIILITAPFEIYLMTIDYNIATKVFYTAFNPQEILSLYVKRVKVLSSFSLIEIFSYFAIVFLAVFQPLKMKKVK